MKQRFALSIAFLVVSMTLLGLILSGCTKSNPTQYSIKTASKTAIGTYLVDSKGITLYYYTLDERGKSNVPNALKSTWPSVSITNLTVSSDLNMNDFSYTLAGYGENNNQVTFKGWPLYYYTGDTSPGDVKGNGVNGFSVAAPSKMSPAK